MVHEEDQQSKGEHHKGCPHLGIYSDISTRYSYASRNNACHLVKKKELVCREHQLEYCLTSAYKNCSVFKGEYKRALPDEIRLEVDSKPFNPQLLLIGIATVILIPLLLFLLGGWAPVETFLSFNHSTATLTATLLVKEEQVGMIGNAPLEESLTPTHTYTPVEEASVTLTPEIDQDSTSTQSPTATTTLFPTSPSTLYPSPGPLLETPFGSGSVYLIHQVSSGENLTNLAERYKTTIEVIRKINQIGGEFVLRVDQVIVLRPGITDPDLVEAMLSRFVEEETPLAEIAAEFSVSEEVVRSHNNLGEDSIIPGGRWLVLPIWKATPTQSATPTAASKLDRALTEPFGPDNRYVLHQVEAGESIPLIANYYSTSNEVIQAVNLFEYGVREGQVLVILPNWTDPNGLIPLKAMQMDERVLVDDLAIQLEVLLSELLYQNGLTAGTTLVPGQWIVYPDRGE